MNGQELREWGRAQRRTFRRQRKEHREDLESQGRTPARHEWVYRVEVEVIAIPRWAYDKAESDLGWSIEHVWIRDRILASIICRRDRENGGHPKLDRFEARRCHRCGMLRIGVLAEGRRKLDESAVDGRDLPCSPECVLREQQRRGKGTSTTLVSEAEASEKGSSVA